LKNKFLWAIAALAFISIFFFNLPFPLIVLTAAIIGYLASKKYPSFFTGGGHTNKVKKIMVPH
jgi:chromate transporter